MIPRAITQQNFLILLKHSLITYIHLLAPSIQQSKFCFNSIVCALIICRQSVPIIYHPICKLISASSKSTFSQFE